MKTNGFTLAEVLFAVILIGIAVAALVGSNQALTYSNGAGVELSTAEFLIEQVRELTALLDVIDPQGGLTHGPEEGSLVNYDDIDDFDNASFFPPIDSQREQITVLSAYTQTIVVENVSPSNFNNVVADNLSSFVRVTVEIQYAGRSISSQSWIRTRY